MIGKILGAAVGAKVAEGSDKLGPTGGALLGVAASLLVRRISAPSLMAIAAGAYIAKLHGERRF